MSFLRRVVARRAVVALGALSTTLYFTHARAADSIFLPALAQSPPPTHPPSATSPAPLTTAEATETVSNSETVSAKYLIVGGGVAALHAVAAIRELYSEKKKKKKQRKAKYAVFA
jgi:hypothetical protein